MREMHFEEESVRYIGDKIYVGGKGANEVGSKALKQQLEDIERKKKDRRFIYNSPVSKYGYWPQKYLLHIIIRYNIDINKEIPVSLFLGWDYFVYEYLKQLPRDISLKAHIDSHLNDSVDSYAKREKLDYYQVDYIKNALRDICSDEYWNSTDGLKLEDAYGYIEYLVYQTIVGVEEYRIFSEDTNYTQVNIHNHIDSVIHMCFNNLNIFKNAREKEA